MMTNHLYPPVALYFSVWVNVRDMDGCFSRVLGLSAAMGAEDLRKGEQNMFVHKPANLSV